MYQFSSEISVIHNRQQMFLYNMQESTCDLHVTRDQMNVKPGPISTVVQDTISDRHEYANLTWITFGMANVKHAAECEDND